jgi:hypothetical protein
LKLLAVGEASVLMRRRQAQRRLPGRIEVGTDVAHPREILGEFTNRPRVTKFSLITAKVETHALGGAMRRLPAAFQRNAVILD